LWILIIDNLKVNEHDEVEDEDEDDSDDEGSMIRNNVASGEDENDYFTSMVVDFE